MKDSDGNSLDDGSVELIVAKQRNGPVGTVNLKFEAEYTRFANVTASFSVEHVGVTGIPTREQVLAYMDAHPFA
jgi:hypothetical protein